VQDFCCSHACRTYPTHNRLYEFPSLSSGFQNSPPGEAIAQATAGSRPKDFLAGFVGVEAGKEKVYCFTVVNRLKCGL
jgi:hypothetical protein